MAAPGKPQIQANPAHETNGLDVLALCIMRKYFDGKHEIWLRPFLQRFRNEHAELSEQERKSALTKLQTSGAITIQKRPGQPNDYSVIVLNWNNDLVQAQNT